MTSETEQYREVFVWLWLPGEMKPVVAGRFFRRGNILAFNYGRSYLARENAIPIYDRELPLKSGVLASPDGLDMPGCIRDGSPDAWGRRVILNKISGRNSKRGQHDELNEIGYLLESGSDRIGALDFQISATKYIPRFSKNVPLQELLASAQRVENGIPLSADLDQALFHGTSIGGARPKALVESGGKKYVAKFSSSSDVYNVIKAEFVAMRLAHLAGLNVAPVSLMKSSGKDVLLIERFDRMKCANGWQRKSMISALTLFGLDEMMARYASYQMLAELIRHQFRNPLETLHELFGRIVFNILSGNTDDHARNHAAFWDGKMLSLTPAYDICPQGRTGNESSQAMLISDNKRISRLCVCIEAAHNFHLSQEAAAGIIDHQLDILSGQWDNVCDLAGLGEAERNYFWGRQFCNSDVCYDLPEEFAWFAKKTPR